MDSFKINIQPTSNETIIKFETNQFITQHQSFEFNNIDEAKDSPIAQQLFHLPFVKKVYISSNFIAIERYNIIDWKSVQDEVAEQIEKYLNSGKPVTNISEETTSKKIAVLLLHQFYNYLFLNLLLLMKANRLKWQVNYFIFLL